MLPRHSFARFAAFIIFSAVSFAQLPTSSPLVDLDRSAAAADFPIAADGRATDLYLSPQTPETVRVAAEAFASDVEQVTGVKPLMLTSLAAPLPANLILVGVLGRSPEIDALVATGKLDVSAVSDKWESAVTAVVSAPRAGVRRALVIAGSDRRGAAFALFTLSRQMGVSPWAWWADVPVSHHATVYVRAGQHIQPEPSVQYRGIFLNDEDWGLRPWASKKMDPTVDNGKGNIGPNTYERIFELLLRLHANSLWPAMHPGSLPFNAVPENARLADKWGIVMGSSHSEALLRNNVGEWNEAVPPNGNGPWNFQTNSTAMIQYWDKRLVENGKFDNFYTVGLRGVHDSGLEAIGSPAVKAKLVEDAMAAQRALLAKRVSPDLAKIPQIIWLYKESLDLYRVGMKVPDDVTLGWTDDNYGYIRELPNAAEQKRAGGSGVYYHVSYWGSPHDYLWLCTTPPALIREEMTKAYDHNARKYWILNVGDLKPAEIDIDYFMQLAWDEPGMAKMTQREFLTRWAAEQFPALKSNPMHTTIGTLWKGKPAGTVKKILASGIADALTRYYSLSFIRKPEFMGFNGYNDEIKRTQFNPLVWGGDVNDPEAFKNLSDPAMNQVVEKSHIDENHFRLAQWLSLIYDERDVRPNLPDEYINAYFELVQYPIQASASMNNKLLFTDLTYLAAHDHDEAALATDTIAAKGLNGFAAIQMLTETYNSLDEGKWDGMMSDAPRERPVFEMPHTATMADADKPLPASWGAGDAACQSVGRSPASPPNGAPAANFVEQHCTVSINAAHFTHKSDAKAAIWNALADLGISGDSVVYGKPGLLANAEAVASAQESPWLDYDFTTTTNGPATLTLHLLPTFAVDSDHRLRYAVSLDGHTPIELDASGPDGHGPDTATWSANVLSNSAIAIIPLGPLAPGKHTISLLYRDPGVVFEHLVLTFPGAPPAYPVPPETR